MKKLLTVLIMATLTLTACSKGDTATDGGTLKVGMGADVASFDPHGKNDQPSSRVRANMYESLIYQDEKLNLIPLLATSWSLDDTGTVWTFKLREGVKFHNGEDFNSEDVVFTFNRGKASTNVGHLLEVVEEIRAIDDYTVELELLYPYTPLLTNLSHTAMGMLDKGTVEAQGDKYASGSDGNIPIGTGQFKFDNFVQGQGSTIVKNENYWDKDNMAKADKIELLVYTDNSSRKLALEAGDIDLAYDIAAPDFASIESNPDLKFTNEYDFSYAYAGFNMQNPIFEDVRVREAINLAVDIDSMVQAPTIVNGLGVEANTPMSMTVYGWAEEVEAYGYNPERAKELLKEAGQENLKFSIWTNENPTRVQAATVMQSQLAEVGIEVDVVQMEWGAYLDSTAKGEHDIFILGWVSSTGGADNGLYPIFHSSKMGAAGNRTFYKNPEVDALLEEGRSETVEEKRLEIYAEAQQKIMDDYVHIPLWYLSRVHAMKNNVEGFISHPSGTMKLHNVYVDTSK